jgi:hypothetical protein
VYKTKEATSAYAVTFDVPGPIDPTFVNTVETTVYRCRVCGEKATYRETEYGRTKRLEEQRKLFSIIRNVSLAAVGFIALLSSYFYFVRGSFTPFFDSFLPLVLLVGFYGVTAPVLSLLESIFSRIEKNEHIKSLNFLRLGLNTFSIFSLVFLLQLTFLNPTPLEVVLSAIGSFLTPIGWMSFLRFRNNAILRRNEREELLYKRMEYERELEKAIEAAGSAPPVLNYLEEQYADVIGLPPTSTHKLRTVGIYQQLEEAPLLFWGVVPGLGMLVYSLSVNTINFVSLEGFWHTVVYWLVTSVATICLSFGLLALPGISKRLKRK